MLNLLAIPPQWDLFHLSAFFGVAVPVCAFFSWIYHSFEKKVYRPWKEQNERHHKEDLAKNEALSKSIDRLDATINNYYSEFDNRFTRADEVHSQQEKHLAKHDDQISDLQNETYFLKRKAGIHDED